MRLSRMAKAETEMAIYYLDKAAETWDVRNGAVRLALEAFGDQGPRISGCEREHFPDETKETLRMLAHEWGRRMDESLRHWRDGGRRVRTWRRLKDSRPDAAKLFCYF